jgi:hypothetical protein
MQDELAASLGELLKHTSGHTSPSLGCMVKPSPHPSPRRPGTPRLHILLHALARRRRLCGTIRADQNQAGPGCPRVLCASQTPQHTPMPEAFTRPGSSTNFPRSRSCGRGFSAGFEAPW